MAKSAKVAADYILPLYMNGLSGRMLTMPSQKKKGRQILLVYGHHASLERWFGLVENLAEYGTVTMPDLPGFGGMQSFSKIGLKPDIDNFADYLSAFIKFKYKKKRITIFAISYGFVVVTRMLQRYPELAGQVDMLVSSVGFMKQDDIVFKQDGQYKQSTSNRVKFVMRCLSRFFAAHVTAFVIRHFFLERWFLNTLYMKFPNSKRRMIEITPDEFHRNMEMEVNLWQANDVRTHWLTTKEMLKFDNTKQRIDLPVVHVISKEDHYLDNVRVEESMRRVFSSYQQFTSPSKAHVPSVIADKKAMAVMIPAGLRRILRRNTNTKAV